jgi:hypothetical protein
MTTEETEPIPDATDEPPTPEQDAEAGTGEPAADPSSASASDPRPAEAWDDVLAKVTDLGDAISRWAKTAKDDPENRRKLDEVKAGMNDMARQAQTTFESIDETEFGKSVRQGAEETGRVLGDAAQRVSDAAAPHVAVIFAGLADAFGKAAASVDEQARRASAPAGPARTSASASDAADPEPEPAPEPEPESAPEPTDPDKTD